LCLLDSALSNGGNVLIHGHQFMEWMWLFPFLNVGMNSLVMTFYVHSTVKCGVCVCIMPSVFTRDKVKIVFMLH
jgi:hypothetical protein